MALGLHFLHIDTTGLATLQYAIRRRGTNTYFDFGAAQAFSSSPATKWQALSQSAAADEAGFYWAIIEPLPATFGDDQYFVIVRNSATPQAVGGGVATVYQLDDGPVLPAAVWGYSSRRLTGGGLNAVLVDGLPLPTVMARLLAERTGEWDLNAGTGLVTYLSPGGVTRMVVTPTNTQRRPTWTDPTLPSD